MDSEMELIRVGDYWRHGIALEAACRCGHRRLIPASFLANLYPEEQRLTGHNLEALGRRMRCWLCGAREPTLTLGRFE